MSHLFCVKRLTLQAAYPYTHSLLYFGYVSPQKPHGWVEEIMGDTSAFKLDTNPGLLGESPVGPSALEYIL